MLHVVRTLRLVMLHVVRFLAKNATRGSPFDMLSDRKVKKEQKRQR